MGYVNAIAGGQINKKNTCSFFVLLWQTLKLPMSHFMKTGAVLQKLKHCESVNTMQKRKIFVFLSGS